MYIISVPCCPCYCLCTYAGPAGLVGFSSATVNTWILLHGRKMDFAIEFHASVKHTFFFIEIISSQCNDGICALQIGNISSQVLNSGLCLLTDNIYINGSIWGKNLELS